MKFSPGLFDVLALLASGVIHQGVKGVFAAKEAAGEAMVPTERGHYQSLEEKVG